MLVNRQIAFPKTHAIERLLELVTGGGIEIPKDFREAPALTRYAYLTRYPRVYENVSRETYLHVLSLAERVVRWAEALIAARQ